MLTNSKRLSIVATAGLAVLALTGATAARAAANEDVISDQSYASDLDVSATAFTCTFTPGRAGTYIPRDTAWANLVLGIDDLTVFHHDAAGLTVEAAAAPVAAATRRVVANPSDLCPAITAIVNSGTQRGGKVATQKHLVLSIVKYPNAYTQTCERFLKETLDITFSTGVVLTSEQYRGLQPLPQDRCR